MRVVIRVDASQAIGSGHVMRCATLAAALREPGAEVHFVCRELPGNYANWLRARGFAVTLLPAPSAPQPPGGDPYATWLGCDAEIETAQCRATLANAAIDWLVVDHYALDAAWERAVCPPAARVLVIDDLANRAHACGLLLDQNYHVSGAARYAVCAPNAELLLGPSYALLRPDFAACRAQLLPRTGQVRKLLVFLGGSDNTNVTSTVLRALARTNRRDLQIDVIVGLANPHLEELRSHCELVGAHLYTQVDDMAARMADADLAIGATGVATWERAALGLPTLAVSVAENQKSIARQAHALGLLCWLGDAETIDENCWIQAIDWACTHPHELRDQSYAGMAAVDGMGVHRVVERMLTSSALTN